MKTIIHVNRHVLSKNRKTGRRTPPLTIKTYKSTRRATAVRICGPCKVVYRPDRPLACGATVWIETHAKVVTITKQRRTHAPKNPIWTPCPISREPSHAS
jgi:hypothetical protein